MRALVRAVGRGFRNHATALATLTGLAAALGGVLMLAVYGASHKAEFCTTCHYMDPYYRQWQTSSHSDVQCIDCHPFRPVQVTVSALRYATGTHDSRPRAEVRNASCLAAGCHDERLLEGEVQYKGKIRFDHATHLQTLRRGKRLQCTSCHSQVVQGQHIAVTEETCFLCHFKGVGEAQAIGGCTVCHGTPTETVEHEGFSFNHASYIQEGVACQQCHLEVTEGTGDVPRTRCFNCHVERLDQYDNTQLIHATHVTEHDIDCLKCHEQIRHGQVRMIRALETGCENCHQGLHTGQKEMYLGSGGEGVHDIPSRMFAAQVSCDGCHVYAVHLGTPEFDETSLEAQRQSCVSCHGQGYDFMLDDWMREMHRLVADLGPELERVEAVLERDGQAGADVVETRLLVQKARHNYDFLKFGRGVHNVEYAVRLAQAAGGYIDRAAAALEAAYRPPRRSRLVATPDGYCTILCHARLGLPEQVDFEHMEFPHAVHVSDVGVECTTCHSPEQHKKRVITRSECMACHHEAQDIDCSHCHPATVALYTGEGPAWDVAGDPDVMLEAEVECLDCHDLSAELDLGAVQEACVDCHEPGYDEILREWVTEIQAGVGAAQVRIAALRQALAGPARRHSKVAEVERLVARGERLVGLVDEGRGVHNYELSLGLLAKAGEHLAAAEALLR